MTDSAEVVVCGAGIAGVSAAFHLAVRRGVRNVVLVDRRAPLSPSFQGAEAYRDWWPGADDSMVRLLSRSLDLLEELAHDSARAFRRSRRGYAVLTADPDRAKDLLAGAEAVAGLGAGPLRRHPGLVPYLEAPPEGFAGAPAGADWIDDPEAIRRAFPFVTGDVRALLHVRRAGWLDSQALGCWLLECAEAHGVRVLRDEVTGVETEGGRVRAVRLASGRLATGTLVLAPGLSLHPAGKLLGLDLPLTYGLHGEATFADPERAVPRNVPLLVWNDPVELEWAGTERSSLVDEAAREALLHGLPGPVHLRPRDELGDPQWLAVWTWNEGSSDGASPPAIPELPAGFGEAFLRSLARKIPGLEGAVDRGVEVRVVADRSCRTSENRPLIGPLPVAGAYVLGALSDYGVMASQAAAELLAAHITEAPLPPWAPAFHPGRFDDPGYALEATGWGGW